MNRIIYWALYFLAISLMISCVSFKIQPPADPENQVEALVLCKRIEQKDGLIFPGASLVEFEPGDGSIHCYVRLKNVSQTIRLKWKWYAPDERLYRETKEVIVNRDVIYLETVTAYDHIELKHQEYEEGRWAVAVLLDGQLIGRRTFQVIGDGTSESHYSSGAKTPAPALCASNEK
jgi:hypothetical protein